MSADATFGSTLLRTWANYRQCAARSAALARRLQRSRFGVLLLTTAGAAFGATAVSLGFTGEVAAEAPWLVRAAGAAGAVCLGLAAVLTHHVLQSSFERDWVMLRSMAEALKSEAFKYMAKAPPYDGDNADDELSDRAKDVLGDGPPGDPIALSGMEKSKNLPSGWLSVDDYIRLRAREQIDRYYRPQAVRNAVIVSRIRAAALTLGAFGAVLGGIAALEPDASWTAAWVAVVGTVSGGVGAYLYAGRFQYLSASYDLTALRLEWLIDDWERQKRKDPAASPADFIVACENAISIENKTWVAEWSKKKPARPSTAKTPG